MKASIPTTAPDILFFWISISVIAFASGFLGGSIRPDDAELIVPPAPQGAVVFQDRSRGLKEDREMVAEILSATSQSMVALYRWQPGKAPSPYDSFPNDAQLFGYALIVTSDGWLVTSASDVLALSPLTAVTYDAKRYPILQRVADESAGYVFLKIDARNLRPIDFPDASESSFVEDGFLIRDRETLERMTLSALRYPPVKDQEDLIHRTRILARVHNPEFQSPRRCLPVVRNTRIVLGCTAVSGIRSFRFLKQSLADLLKNGVIERPHLDIPYIDLDTSTIVSEEKVRRGARVTLPQGTASLSLAGADGSRVRVQNGDVIIAVNDEEINRNRTFAELIHQYNQGDKISLRMVSNGSERTISIILN